MVEAGKTAGPVSSYLEQMIEQIDKFYRRPQA